VLAARRAFPAWHRLGWRARVAFLRRAAVVLDEGKLDLAIACLIEVGKSRLEAMGEVEESIDLIRYYCDEMEVQNGFERPLKRAFEREATASVQRPHGAFGVIAPFNFPVALSVNMVTTALLAGNTVVYKPSPSAGLTGWLLVDALQRAGLPPGVLNLVCGDASVGEALVGHAGIDGIAFTGSNSVGMSIHRALAQGRAGARPVIAEMGGKNPAYVTQRADLDAAAAGVMRSAFGLQGQKCSACSVVFVHDDVADAFLGKLLELTHAIQIGDPRRREVFMGPLINQAAARRFEAAVATAKHEGQVLTGGRLLAGGAYGTGCYAAPTVVGDLPAHSRIHGEELFLPFLALRRFRDFGVALAAGNAVPYGLTAGVYTCDEEELQRFLDEAQAGVLYANRASGATTGAWPGVQSFCGWKGSGTTGKGGLGPWYLPQFMREQSHTVMRRGTA
jgi:1-pyrroline-5-carboxylate dehydrogenase